jgi:hypothetical protein
MISTAILIMKLSWSNYKQWSGDMVLPLVQKQVYGMVMGSVVNRPVRRSSPAVRPQYLQDGRDGAKAVRPVLAR